MPHYITVPVNANGIIYDATMNEVVTEAMAVVPFGFRDVFIYSHGWSTDADSALDVYSKFSVELARMILTYSRLEPNPFQAPPMDTLGIGIHWPSEITEDPSSVLNNAQLLTFYTMEHRADAVGSNAVYTMLRLMLRERDNTGVPLRIFMIGHSFGCKVILSALQDLKVDVDGDAIILQPGTEFNVALLEAATDNDNLEPGDIYGLVSTIPALRLMMTTSSQDKALGTFFPLAGKIANLLHKPPSALGFAGPTDLTCTAAVFGAPAKLDVALGFTADALTGINDRFVIADLSEVHQQRATQGLYTTGGFAGSHSDISFEEMYELLCGFFYRA